jgi:hypothetical protein
MKYSIIAILRLLSLFMGVSFSLFFGTLTVKLVNTGVWFDQGWYEPDSYGKMRFNTIDLQQQYIIYFSFLLLAAISWIVFIKLSKPQKSRTSDKKD